MDIPVGNAMSDNLEIGPFITVVSVDGGNNFGNKLTVITPVDATGSTPSPSSNGTDYGYIPSSYDNFCTADLLKTIESVENALKCTLENNQDESSNGAAYVTVLALGNEKSVLKAGDRRSIVNILNETEGLFPTEQLFDTSINLLSPNPIPNSLTEEDNSKRTRRRHRSVVCIEEKHPEAIENVIIYRLPGERLGFGLKFDGEPVDAGEKVKRLYIQSCTPESPAARAEASWGLLTEGDEILEIENIPVYSLSRVDCIQALKDAPVAVNLLIRHLYSPDELQLITRAKVVSSSDLIVNCSNSDWISQDSLSPSSSQNTASSESDLYDNFNDKKSLKYSINSSESAYESNSPINSENEYELEPMNLETASKLAHQIVMEIEEALSSSIAQLADTNTDPAPIPIPRKRNRSGVGDNLDMKDYHLVHPDDSTVDKKISLKPPAEFDDTLNEIKENINQNQHLLLLNETLCNDSVLDPESYYSTFVEIEDGTASTRSTVISRLSMSSYNTVSGFPEFLSTLQQSNLNMNNNNGIKNMNSLIGGYNEHSSDHQNNFYICPEEKRKLTATRSKSSVGLVSLREGDSEVPLEPPLCFQDTKSSSTTTKIIENDPVFYPTKPKVRRSKSLVNIVYNDQEPRECNSANGQFNTQFEEEFIMANSQDLIQMYEDNSDLASFNNENGQESDYTNMNMNLKNDEEDDSDVMIRIEWLHEIEEEISPLEIDPIPLIQVIPKDTEFKEEDYEDHTNDFEANYNVKKTQGLIYDSDLSKLTEDFISDNRCEIMNNANIEENIEASQDNTVSKFNSSLENQELIDDSSSQTILTEESSSFVDYKNYEKVKVIEVLVKNQLQWIQEIEPNCNGTEPIGVANEDIIVQHEHTEDTAKNSPPPIVERKHKKISIMKEMTDEIAENHNNTVHPVNNEETQEFCTPIAVIQNEIKETENGVVDCPKGLFKEKSESQVDYSEEKMLNQIFILRPLPVGTIQFDSLITASHVEYTGNAFKVDDSDLVLPVIENEFSGVEENPNKIQADEVGINFQGAIKLVSETQTHLSFQNLDDGPKECEVQILSVEPRKQENVDYDKDNQNPEASPTQQPMHKSILKSQQLVTDTDFFGSSADGAEEFLPPSTPPLELNISEMDNQVEILQSFNPPSFSRLPPDGHEFPSNWMDDDRNSQAYVTHRSELSLKEISPPPIPNSAPPTDDYEQSPPPLPSSVPPVPPMRLNLARRTSIEDRKKVFESVSLASTKMQLAKPSEPSKRSVKDKIAMFSQSSEDSVDGKFPNIQRKSSMNGSIKSSENLLFCDENSNGCSNPLNRSTADLTSPVNSNLIRKHSVNEVSKKLHHNEKLSNLSERSQSMIDVAGEANSYPCQGTYRSPNGIPRVANINNHSTNSPTASHLMEQRRKCMTKLRGLVIPDKTEVRTSSASVMDLPTIISKDAVVPPVICGAILHSSKQTISRTESLDRMSSYNPTSAKMLNNDSICTEWISSAPSALPKYSPAFKRRSLTPYQNSITAPIIKPKINQNGYKTLTPEPKSLESITSPRSDSSFEYLSSSPITNEPTIVAVTRIQTLTSIRNQTANNDDTKFTSAETKQTNTTVTKFSNVNVKNGKMDDSDNDSAVSSSRSSISHELSPPTSPAPGDTLSHLSKTESHDNNTEEDSANNSDEADRWRVLKAQSVEAINRKNVITSAKFSSGVVLETQSNTNRRSDDEEASYADAEAEDTESSCSEVESTQIKRRQLNIVRSPTSNQRKGSKGTNEIESERLITHSSPVHSQQSSLDLAEFGPLTESPLQAIFDMEVKMAYINEICDTLPTRNDMSGSRCFSRRDSEATVIERPIDRKLSTASSIDQIDSAVNMRARNRSSSGNESDFSSSISLASQTNPITTSEDSKWQTLDKKHSKSLTSVNLLGKSSELKPMPSTVPKIVTHASGIVEKKIERIIEKTETSPTKCKVTGANIPRGRNDFKSLSEKWQQISNTTEPNSPVTSPVKLQASPPRLDSTETSPRRSVGLGAAAAALAAVEADRAWAERRANRDYVRSITSDTVQCSVGSTKRSVSVNDIRRAFERAEQAVNNYGRDDKSPKDSPGILSPPSAHFRVSSFDSTTSEESSATTPGGIYGSVNSLLSSTTRDPYGSITSLASSTSLISPQELQQLIDEANQSLEEAGTPSHEVAVVILHREFAGGSLGITLAGGADYETKEITVHKVLTGSIADRDGRVHRGDRVLSINGKNTKGLSHREALNLLKAPRTEVVLVVSRGRSGTNGFQTIEETSATLDRAVEPLLNGSLASLLENDEDKTYNWGQLKTVILFKDGAGLGFSLEGGKGSINGDKPLTVKKIFVGGPAEKSGELKVGDLITTINDTNMAAKSRTEAWNFMKKLGDGEVKLTVRSPV